MRELFKNLLQPNQTKRTAFFLVFDFLITVLSLYCAFLIRFEFVIPPMYKAMFIKALPFFVIIKIMLFGLFGLYKITWRYVGISELNRIYVSAVVSESLLMIMILIPF